MLRINSWCRNTLRTVLVLALLALDLGIFHHKDHKVSAKEGLIWSGIWITVSLCFNVVIYVIILCQ